MWTELQRCIGTTCFALLQNELVRPPDQWCSATESCITHLADGREQILRGPEHVILFVCIKGLPKSSFHSDCFLDLDDHLIYCYLV